MLKCPAHISRRTDIDKGDAERLSCFFSRFFHFRFTNLWFFNFWFTCAA